MFGFYRDSLLIGNKTFVSSNSVCNNTRDKQSVSRDFIITRVITDRIELHAVQLRLLIFCIK